MGVGLGAGVGGLAGAEGRWLCGIMPEDTGLDMGIGRGGGRVMGPFRFDLDTGEGKMDGGAGSRDLSSSEYAVSSFWPATPSPESVMSCSSSMLDRLFSPVVSAKLIKERAIL